jgi:hypothetical protein
VEESKDPDKSKLHELMNNSLNLLQISKKEVKQQEKLYTFATNASTKLEQKPIENKFLHQSYHKFCGESRQIQIQPELSNALDHIFTDWQTQFLREANDLVSEFLKRLRDLNPYYSTFLNHFDKIKKACLKIGQCHNTLLKLNSDTQSSSKGTPDLINQNSSKKARLHTAQDSKCKELLTSLDVFCREINSFIENQGPDQMDVIALSKRAKSHLEQFSSSSLQNQMSKILDHSFIGELEEFTRQIISSRIQKAELEQFDQIRTDLIDKFETMNHLKAFLVNPRKPANYESDSKIRDELYRITSMIWSSKVYIHTGFVNAEGVNRVDFYFADGFPFDKPEDYIELVSNTAGIPSKDVKLAINPVDNKKVALNIEGGIDNISKLKDNAQELPKCSIKIGSFDSMLENINLDSRYHRKYGKGPGCTYWRGDCKDGRDRGGYPYYCPVGWQRYSLKVNEFDKKYTGWPIAYHGTKDTVVAQILSTGLRTNRGCFLPSNNDITAAYFSPCIEYSAHPRYANIFKGSNDEFLQVVLQCRVNPKFIKVGRETLGVGNNRIHPLYDNKKITWYVESRNNAHLTDKEYICTGIMVRSHPDPWGLPESHWWYPAKGFNLHLKLRPKKKLSPKKNLSSKPVPVSVREPWRYK